MLFIFSIKITFPQKDTITDNMDNINNQKIKTIKEEGTFHTKEEIVKKKPQDKITKMLNELKEKHLLSPVKYYKAVLTPQIKTTYIKRNFESIN